jgi:hypothetical protein
LRSHAQVKSPISHRFTATPFRRARATAPCGDCQGGQCDDHGRDVGLISEYERTARRLQDEQ